MWTKKEARILTCGAQREGKACRVFLIDGKEGKIPAIKSAAGVQSARGTV
jgi:hypothetical protein